MCRSILTLRGAEPVSDEDVRAAALQFVRKISGYRSPSKANREAFDHAVDDITAATERLLGGLSNPTPVTASAPRQHDLRRHTHAPAG